MVKKLYIYMMLGLMQLLVAQNGKQPHHHKSEEITLGDKHFNNGDYFLAIQYYQKALETFSGDPYVHHQLAESQRIINDYVAAEPNYKAVVDYIDKQFSKTHHHEDYPLVRFRYATILKANEKCDLAREQFELFINHFKKDATLDDKQYHERALLEYNGCTFMEGEKAKVDRNYGLKVLPEPVNSGTSEYAPAIFVNDTTISITATRGGNKEKKMYNTTGQSFSDVYMFKLDGETWKDISVDQSFNKINEPLNDGAGCFNAKKDKYYFTKCDVKHTESNGECNIYYTKLEKFKWTTPKALNGNINMKGYWSGQPCLSGGGDTLFFVSKRPKGKGHHDIWYSTKSGDGENWGVAKNLDKINTPFSEVSPFFDKKTKNLYFSSNGYEGMGELDIFRTVDSTLTSSHNVGMPFNSTRDDFYYIHGDKYGYLVSNREGGVGSDDIYKFNIVSVEDIIAEIPKDSIAEANSISVNGKLMMADKTTPASNISVLIKDSTGTVIRKMNTDDEGKFRFESMEGKKYYKVVLEKERTDILADVEYTVKDYKLRKFEKLATKATFEHVFFDFDDYKLRPEGKIVLDKLFDVIQKNPQLQIELGAYTDNFGPSDYNLKLSELRSKEAFNYLKAKGIDKTALVQGFGEDAPLASNDNPIGRQLNRRLDFGIIGADSIKSYGQVYITSIDQTVDEVATMFKVPQTEIRRMNGVTTTKLQSFRPVRLPGDGIHIISDITLSMANGTEYNKYNKQYDNANVAALGNKGEISQEDGQTYYIVAKGNTVYSISKFFRMKPEELIQLNELDGFEIKFGQKLKVIDNREQD